MYKLWEQRLGKDDAKKGWVMDGFPRNAAQAQFLFDKVKDYDYTVDKALYLKIRPEETLRRLQLRHREQFAGAGKNHDDPDLIKSRLAEFAKGQEPLLAFLKEQGVLEEVDGERSVEEIHQDILARLENA